MGVVITEGDIAFLNSSYPEMDITIPTGQQQQLLLYYFRGLSIPKSAQQAGYRGPESARRFLASDSAIAILELLREREFTDIRINLDSITAMFMEAYNSSATAMEKIAATRELAKLHDLYPDAKKAGLVIDVKHSNIGEANVKQIQQMTDAQLAEAVGVEMLELVQNEHTIEGEAEEIKE